MLKIRLLALAILLMTIIILAMIMTMPMVSIAQDVDVGTPPVAITPGAPFKIQVGEVVPTLPFTDASPETDYTYEVFAVNTAGSVSGAAGR